jgi:PH (Pleckstrin Homology) domain-containing protein
MPDAAVPPSQVTAVPRRMRQICALCAAVVVLALAFVALTLPSSSTGVVRFHASDQIAVAGIGLVLGAAILCLGRARVDADASGVTIKNVVGGRTVPWSMVRAVAFDRKSPWATLRLTNDDEVTLFAVQAIDRERALRATEGLRALLAAAKAEQAAAEARLPAPPPLLYDN